MKNLYSLCGILILFGCANTAQPDVSDNKNVVTEVTKSTTRYDSSYMQRDKVVGQGEPTDEEIQKEIAYEKEKKEYEAKEKIFRSIILDCYGEGKKYDECYDRAIAYSY